MVRHIGLGRKKEFEMKQHRNQHEWGVVAQCKNPYREFAYCPLCRQYQEDGLTEILTRPGRDGRFTRDMRMTPKSFTELGKALATINPMYHADSNDLINFERR